MTHTDVGLRLVRHSTGALLRMQIGDRAGALADLAAARESIDALEARLPVGRRTTSLTDDEARAALDVIDRRRRVEDRDRNEPDDDEPDDD